LQCLSSRSKRLDEFDQAFKFGVAHLLIGGHLAAAVADGLATIVKIVVACGLMRDEIYICNVLKCRPPGNRNPEPDEVAACEPFLVRQLRAIGPEVIVALGKFAAQTLLRSKTPITQLRGRWFDYQGIMLMPTFHPAYLLRNPGEKRLVWEDIQKVMRVLGLPIAGK
jgi:DNA polymerase